MAKPPKKPKPEEIEPEPGAWERFEHAVDAAVKSGPKHRTATGKIVSPKHRTKNSEPTFFVIGDKMRVAGNVRRNDDGSITADVYRNLSDYESDHAMERAAKFMTD